MLAKAQDFAFWLKISEIFISDYATFNNHVQDLSNSVASNIAALGDQTIGYNNQFMVDPITEFLQDPNILKNMDGNYILYRK